MGAFPNIGEFSDAQQISAAGASTNYIDLAMTRQQIGVGVPIYICIRTNTAPTQSADTLSIELQNDAVNTFNGAGLLIWMLLSGAAGAELAGTVARLATAGAWIYRGVLPYECSLRYLRLYYNNTTSNGTFTIDAWLALSVQSDIGKNAQVWVSPVGNP